MKLLLFLALLGFVELPVAELPGKKVAALRPTTSSSSSSSAVESLLGVCLF